MLQIYAKDFVELGRLFENIGFRRHLLTERPLQINQDMVGQLLVNLRGIQLLCVKMDLASSVEMCVLLIQRYEQDRLTWSQLIGDLELLERSVIGGFEKGVFYHIPAHILELLIQPGLRFGSKVSSNFRSASFDMKEADKCFALERYTASVFHCMRVLEKGLHALVHDLNNRFNAGIHFSKSIEATNWGNILDEIHHTLTKQNRLQRLNPQPSKDDMQFYSSAAKEFEYFKEAWRDEVSHSRGSYDRADAWRVLKHVEAFMKQISERLSE
jgi:hypothetical protein